MKSVSQTGTKAASLKPRNPKDHAHDLHDRPRCPCIEAPRERERGQEETSLRERFLKQGLLLARWQDPHSLKQSKVKYSTVQHSTPNPLPPVNINDLNSRRCSWRTRLMNQIDEYWRLL